MPPLPYSLPCQLCMPVICLFWLDDFLTACLPCLRARQSNYRPAYLSCLSFLPDLSALPTLPVMTEMFACPTCLPFLIDCMPYLPGRLCFLSQHRF